MNPNRNLQQQQAQMKRQQEQMRRMQKGAAWMEQQKQKAAAEGGGDPFSQLEKFVVYLRQEYAARRVSKEEAEAMLRDSLVKDGKGGVWTVGFETGDWYHLEGGQWIRSEQPPMAAHAGRLTTKPKGRPFLGFLAFLLGCFITFLAGMAAGWFIYNMFAAGGSWDTFAAGSVWLLGFILSVRWGTKLAKG